MINSFDYTLRYTWIDEKFFLTLTNYVDITYLSNLSYLTQIFRGIPMTQTLHFPFTINPLVPHTKVGNIISKKTLFYVLGLGKTGFSTALFLCEQGCHVWAWDDECALRATARDHHIPLAPHPQTLNNDTYSSYILIISPGINQHPIKDFAQRHQWEIMTDVQLFFYFFPHVLAAGVTGSNGKSTTCTLVCHTLNALYEAQYSQKPAIVAGNIGVPIFSTVKNQQAFDGIYILELSSYQLDYSTRIPLYAAALLNITPHHLERHGCMEAYLQTKLKIVHHAHFKVIARCFNTHVDPKIQALSFIEDWLEKYCSWELLPESLQNAHGILNSAAALGLISCLLMHSDINTEKTPDTPHGILPFFKSFKSLPHRQEKLGKIQGIDYINDSKATSPAAAVCALACQKNPVIWLAGGALSNDCMNAYIAVLHLVHTAILFGDSAQKYADFFHSHNVPCFVAQNVKEAVELSFNLGKKEGIKTVLFSPGCTSFDQFKNFEVRGDFFKSCVVTLEQKKYD